MVVDYAHTVGIIVWFKPCMDFCILKVQALDGQGHVLSYYKKSSSPRRQYMNFPDTMFEKYKKKF